MNIIIYIELLYINKGHDHSVLKVIFLSFSPRAPSPSSTLLNPQPTLLLSLPLMSHLPHPVPCWTLSPHCYWVSLWWATFPVQYPVPIQKPSAHIAIESPSDEPPSPSSTLLNSQPTLLLSLPLMSHLPHPIPCWTLSPHCYWVSLWWATFPIQYPVELSAHITIESPSDEPPSPSSTLLNSQPPLLLSLPLMSHLPHPVPCWTLSPHYYWVSLWWATFPLWSPPRRVPSSLPVHIHGSFYICEKPRVTFVGIFLILFEAFIFPPWSHTLEHLSLVVC